PFYVNTEARPWVGLDPDQPRRAGVSAFGFGGTNFHAVLEEYRGDFISSRQEAPANEWPAELLLWSRRSPEQLLHSVRSVEQLLAGGASPSLRDISYTLWQAAREDSGAKLAIVASSIEDLRVKLARVREALERQGEVSLSDQKGVYLIDRPLAACGKVAFLFPGQGSQYPGMLADLAMYFSEAREAFELADRALEGKFPQTLSSYVFPPPGFGEDEQRGHEQALKQTHIAQPALGASGMALMRLYEALGVKPEMVAGHSYGEYVALCSAGVLSEETLYSLSEARGRAINESSEQEPGTMAAIMEGAERVSDTLKSIDGVWIANYNAPRQTVISGTREGVALAIERLTGQGIQARPIQVACAFHTPIVASAQRRFAQVLSATEFAAPRLPVFSNTQAADYADDPAEIAGLLSEHLIMPVRFSEEIQQMYASGARLFVEVGPRSVLTNLTDQILGEQPHVAVASDIASRPSLVQLLHVVGQLAAHGVSVNLDRLFNQRHVTQLKLDTPEAEPQKKLASSAMWLVDGGRARPAFEASPKSEPASKQAHAHHAAAIIKDSRMKRTSEDVQAFAQPYPTAQPSPAFEPKSKPGDGRIAHHNGNGAAGNGHSPIPVNQLAENSEAGQVMAGFQRLMSRFLDTQRNVMLAYLQGSNGAPERRNGHASSNGFSESPPPASVAYKLPELAAATPVAMPKMPAAIAPAQAVARLVETEIPRPAEAIVEPVSVAAPPDTSEREQVAHTLIQIVSERTGYPPDMLNMDVNLEADLGIDSIKHVEIVARLQQSFAPAFQQKIQERMDLLVRTKTLRGIIDLLSPVAEEGHDEKKKLNPPDDLRQTAAKTIATGEEEVAEAPRFILKPLRTQLGRPRESSVTEGVFLITDDERGIARTLAATLENGRARTALVRRGDAVSKLADGLYTADLTDRQQATELLDLIRQQEGRISALLHLLPLSERLEFEKMSLADWQARARLEVNSLFNLAQAAASDLKQGDTAQRGMLLAATSLGNISAGAATGAEPFSLASAGVAGLVKTISLEWPEVACTAAHLDLNETTANLVGQLMQEITTEGREPEVYYRAGIRYTMQSEKSALDSRESTNPLVGPDSVILITGGARGITATVAI
ncbi:MAG TPA: SDR family oxidoreductase, partial [Blastocatellia bacterium]|nr:SDR family oxidoreductase [Blastocatellia bacterium]